MKTSNVICSVSKTHGEDQINIKSVIVDFNDRTNLLSIKSLYSRGRQRVNSLCPGDVCPSSLAGKSLTHVTEPQGDELARYSSDYHTLPILPMPTEPNEIG